MLSDNGVSLQGVSLQGVSLQGVSLQGVSLQGVSLQGVSLQGTVFTGALMAGGTVSGDEFIGTTMTGTLSNGDSIAMRIDAIEPSADPGIDHYTVSYLDGATWTNLCGVSDGVPVRAIPLLGRWDGSQGTATGGSHIADSTMITFGCRTAVLAKCVEMGYKPWESVTECKAGVCVTRSLGDFHQACTRMMRADYCGDGMAHTRNGNTINLWDNFSIQQRADVDDDGDWKSEAEWTAEGSLCVKTFRWDTHVTKDYVKDHCPSRKSSHGVKCFHSSSTFFTSNGFTKPMTSRSLLRNDTFQGDDWGGDGWDD